MLFKTAPRSGPAYTDTIQALKNLKEELNTMDGELSWNDLLRQRTTLNDHKEMKEGEDSEEYDPPEFEDEQFHHNTDDGRMSRRSRSRMAGQITESPALWHDLLTKKLNEYFKTNNIHNVFEMELYQQGRLDFIWIAPFQPAHSMEEAPLEAFHEVIIENEHEDEL
ncbi:hypothetical protein Ciccas_004986 [Cichlidogyrus casuarinus]|uniref:Uncharacterized protein n=1 Tax=Cichlidogyrus casuarinus TaxID=1844966 RepID=A0ABD2Q9X5_9PLAT